LGGFVAPIADLWKGQVYELANYINKISGEIIPEESIKIKPSAELSLSQDVTKGLGDPIIYPYHDKLFASWVERWDRATPEEILKWYEKGTLENEIGYVGKIKDLFKNDEEFVADLEQWWKAYQGLGIAKRIQAPPILCTSRRGFGFDLRESQTLVIFSPTYFKLKKLILEKSNSLFNLNQSQSV
jgi:NAD+ synthase (glutamine-hydrolysing)